MKQHWDRSADALYIRLDDADIVDSRETSPGIVVDFDESNRVVGIEVLRLSRFLNMSGESGRASRTGAVPQEEDLAMHGRGWQGSESCQSPVLS